jgi:UDP-glucose 4-epimerase
MRALVTGGAGFIGSNLVDVLLARGHEVDVVDDLSSGKQSNLTAALDAGARLHQADIREGDAIRALVADVVPETIFHLAAQIDVRVSVADPSFDARTNVEGTATLLEAGRANGLRRFVFASTGGAIYGETDVMPTPETTEPRPMAPYGTSKLCAEQYLGLYERLHGLSTVALRFGNVYGPRQDVHGEAGVIAIFCGRLRRGEDLRVFGDGEQTRDYIYVGDLVDAIATAGDGDAIGAINLGTEEETSVLRVAEILQEHSGSKAAIDFQPARLGEIQRSVLDAGRAREVLGWTAATRIEEGLRLTWEASASA